MSVARIPRPKIDYDILVAIMESMEGPYRMHKNVISLLSRTCKHLHLEGIKSLLARGVYLKASDLASFAHFILAEPTSRGPLLRSLEIDIADVVVVSDTALDVFLRALSHTSRITQLKLDSLEELSRAMARRLCTALEALTSVTDFTIFYVGGDIDNRLERDPSSGREEYFPHLLRHLQSSLTSVTLQLPPMDVNETFVIYKRHRDPIFLLSNQSASLEHVAIHGYITVGGWKCVYPRVTRLSLSSDMGLQLLQPYIACFPSVNSVDFLYSMMKRYPEDTDILRMWRMGLYPKEWHNVNTRNQARFGTWPGIQSWQGTIMDAYVYGISCRITRLHLLSIGGVHSGELAMLSAVLANTLPTFLRLAIKIWFGRDSLPILPLTSANECLTSLEIRINVILQQFDPDTYIDYAKNMLKCMPVLESFQLEFRCLNTAVRDLETGHDRPGVNGGIYCDYPWRGTKCYLRDIMDHVDLYQRVREFMEAAPALRRVTLMWKRCRHPRWDAPPDRVVGIDLDLLPHSVDRRGNWSDMWWDGDW